MVNKDIQINISKDRLNWFTLDVEDDDSFSVTMAIADITDIKQRKGSGSYKITISNTDNNHKILHNIFDISSNKYDFIRKKTHCQVIYKNNVLLDDYFFVIEDCIIDKNNLQNDNITYKARVSNQLTNFYQMIDGLLLTDIDLSLYNHIYNSTSIVDSFTNTYTDGFKYSIPYEYSTSPYLTKDFYPGVFARVYFDKIHEYAGYRYEFGEMEDTNIRMNNLYHPFSGDIKKILEKDYKEYNSKVDRTNSWTFYNTPGFEDGKGMTSSNSKTKYSIENYLEGDEFWDSNTERYVVPATITNPSKLSFKISTNFEVYFENTTAFGLVNCQPTKHITTNNSLTAYLEVFNVTKNSIILSQRLDPTKIEGTGHAYGGNCVTFDEASGTYKIAGPIPVASGISKKLYSSDNQDIIVNLSVSDVEINDNIEFRFRLDFINNDSNNYNWHRSDATMKIINTTSRYKVVVKSFLIEQNFDIQTLLVGLPILMNKMIPQGVKQSEYLSSIMNMYNLYAYIDPLDSKKIIYKTRKKFYKDGKDLGDLSHLVDVTQGQTISYLPNIDTKKYTLRYKYDGNDPFHKSYKNTTEEIYGEQTIIFDNENTKGTKVNELIFSSTANVTTSFGANIPILPSTPDVNMRILLDNGLKSCDLYHISDTVSGINTKYQVEYPHFSMLSDIEKPDFSIEFGIGEFYEYNVRPTYNNLYYNHYSQMFALINSSSLVTLYMHLTPDIINNLMLNETFTINNTKYIFNKIYNYSPDNVYTKVELITLTETYKSPKVTKGINVGSIMIDGVDLTDTTLTVYDTVGNVINTKTEPNPLNDDIDITIDDTIATVIYQDTLTPLAEINTFSTLPKKGININEVFKENLELYRLSNNIYSDPSNQLLGDTNNVNYRVKNTLVLGSFQNIEKSNTIYTENIQTDVINDIKTNRLLSLISMENIQNIEYDDYELYREPGVYYITDRDIYFLLDANNYYEFFRYVQSIKPEDWTYMWSETETYAIDDIVVYSNKYYKNITGDNTINIDISNLNSTDWEELYGYTVPYKIYLNYSITEDIIYSASDPMYNNTIYDLDKYPSSVDLSYLSTWSNPLCTNNIVRFCILNNTSTIIRNNTTSRDMIAFNRGNSIISVNASEITNNTVGIIQSSIINNAIKNNTLVYGDILNTIADEISGCKTSGGIYSNICTGYITVNDLLVTNIWYNRCNNITNTAGVIGAITDTVVDK